MLTNLFIRNIVLIDKLDISLQKGFCVLTGETGAGKSILLGALGLATGKRASATLLRQGEKQGSVTATFDTKDPIITSLLSQRSINIDEEIYLTRVIYDDGKSKSYINDSPVSTSFLNQIADRLIEIHGQHDQKGLFDTKTHRNIIDQYGKLENELAQLKDIFTEYKSLQVQLTQIKENESKAQAEEEYLKFTLKQLTELNPKKGLEEVLASKRDLLLNREKIIETINGSISCLQESGIEQSIAKAQSILISAENINNNFSQIAEGLERASIEISEAISALDYESSTIGEENSDLESIEERLFALRAAAKKHNISTDELEAYIEELTKKIDLIENKETHIKTLEAKLQIAKEKFINEAKALSTKRLKTAQKLEKALEVELKPLKMENTKMKVSIDSLDEDKWSALGIDKIVFLVSTNPGSPFAPIGKIASGGELSRFMLALKVVLSGVTSVPTMIFDEVDTGVGGAVADAIGKRLAKLGQQLQIFAITHQPQVASSGNFHLKVEKSAHKSSTTTSVSPLTNQERKEEIARMLSGDSITDQARSAAQSLLEKV